MPPPLDSGLDQHVDRTADHDQVLDVVAPDEQQPAAPVDGRALDQAEAPVALAQESGAAASAASAAEHEGLERPDRERDERDHEQHDGNAERNG